MKEKWVRINTIEGYEDVKDCYWISNADEDKIMNKNTGKILKIRFSDKGYPIVDLGIINGKYKIYKIHILKAKAFLYTPNPLLYKIVRHLNDVKTDNRLENLAFGTLSDNNLDCIRNGNYNYKAAVRNCVKSAKKRSKPVKCLDTGEIFPSAHEAECKLRIDNRRISDCCHGKRKTAGGFHWEFVNLIAES